MHKDEIITLINDACLKLKTKDEYLFTFRVNERSMTHRLAVYIEELLPKDLKKIYSVDCEYNRDGEFSKRIPNILLSESFQADNIDGPTVFPDINVHIRGKGQENNFIIIEVKKAGDSRKKGINLDIEKLEAYMEDEKYKYQYGYLVILNLDEKSYQIYTPQEARKHFL